MTIKRIPLALCLLILLSFTAPHAQAALINNKWVAHFHPQDNIVGLTNGRVFATYSLNFDLLNQFPIVDDPSINLNGYNFQWSPDGSRLAVILAGFQIAPINTVLQIWDVASSRKLYEIPGADVFTSVAWSPDGTRFAAHITTSDLRNVVRIYDTQNGEELIEIPSSDISQLAWSPTGDQLVFEWPSGVQIWSADTGQSLRTLDAEMNSEINLAFSPIQNFVAFVNLNDSENVLEIWNTDTGKLIHQLQGHTKRIIDFSWNTGGLVSTGADDTIRIWDIETGQQIRAFQAGRYPNAELNADGTKLLVEDQTSGIHVRDAVTGDILAVFKDTLTPESTDIPAATPNT